MYLDRRRGVSIHMYKWVCALEMCVLQMDLYVCGHMYIFAWEDLKVHIYMQYIPTKNSWRGETTAAFHRRYLSIHSLLVTSRETSTLAVTRFPSAPDSISSSPLPRSLRPTCFLRSLRSPSRCLRSRRPRPSSPPSPPLRLHWPAAPAARCLDPARLGPRLCLSLGRETRLTDRSCRELQREAERLPTPRGGVAAGLDRPPLGLSACPS